MRRAMVAVTLVFVAACSSGSPGDGDGAAASTPNVSAVRPSGDGTATLAPPSPTTLPTTTAGPTSTTSSTSSTSTTSTTSTTIDVLAPVRDAYLASEAAYDAAFTAARDEYLDADFGGVLWEDVPTVCAAQADIDAGWASEIGAMTWPPDLQEYADDLVNALTVRADVFRQCSQLGTSYFDQKPIFAQQDDAYRMVANTREFLRRKLRLPSR